MSKLRKCKITNGVFWVEIPEAGVYILCGCPADAVKHLKKQGFIQNRIVGEDKYESGPNAILLSDLLVQNGRFANLAEFPVMQMLYRQGMMLPNHPNNTNAKPMLIGSEDQVEAQMQYIYRGNYGLVSEEELINAGMSPDEAKELMNVKLKFAYGKIHKTKDLLDAVIVKNEPTEIRNGVFIRHLRLNVFELQYQGEFITVDLNLARHENYSAPYSLGFHNIKREYFAIIHSGQGDGWDIKRPAMSSIIMFQGKVYLIDAEPNIANSLIALGINVNEIEGIFHTHAHDDHFAGLTTLMRADHRVKYFATPLVRVSVAKKLSALVSIEEKNFSDYFEVNDLEFNVWNNIDGLEVYPMISPHPVENNIFIFRALCEDGYKTYAHYADTVDLDALNGMISEDNAGSGISKKFYDRVEKEYLQEVTLKKIDIGGGLIHGKAEDFREDTSEKIILSHTSSELTSQQKEIGSGAPFGMVDVLIPTHQEYARQYAFQHLKSYFPSVPLYQVRILLNNPVISFNPETIMLKGGTIPDDIFLILTGNVEHIQAGTGRQGILSAGALIGEMSALNNAPSADTYRAASFVQALRLPHSLYIGFVKKNELYGRIEKIQEKRKFLQKTWLLGYSISYLRQVMLTCAMSFHHYPEGEIFLDKNCSDLYVVKMGKLQIYIGKDVLETLEEGDFFGEEGMLFGMPSLFKIRATEPVEICKISGNELRDIPVIRWKLFETFKKRRKHLLDPTLNSLPIFYWRNEYCINIQKIDYHHKQLLAKANKLCEAIDSKKETPILDASISFLIDFVLYHFAEEENLLREHYYNDYESHRMKHQRLIEDIMKIKKQISNEDMEMNMEALDLFKDWIIDHILTEDRKYGPYLNAKGVF
ncbi:MAG: bacteriohemerythrin [Candidatus Kuenenia stuttgartiensis]|nr:bacteriohemerythrin [Candidatus Kuenenia stuttgartiensis]